MKWSENTHSFVDTDILRLSTIAWLRTNGCCENGFDRLGATGSEYAGNHENYSMTRSQ